ncbi:antibiotic biosynthesis monooxygenase family protein [Loigolactobacillus binensis]|uniref:Antibiotic biosynthesis monooxygenase family protein n=1 Tax=Loigolactobacillus binensis TaxID=2559922 RepID=A0ABW3ECW3_9LACO|nr:antibiotic biosynthesis monooxygenase [Loigolactobacillus binensis]
MIRKIISTFGSQSVLAKYLDREPQRQLLLLKPAETESDFQLLDLSDQPTTFNTPIRYDVRYHSGNNNLTGFFSFMYLTFSSNDEAKVFLAQFDDLAKQADHFIGLNDLFLLRRATGQTEYVIFSTWQRDADFFNWRNSTDFERMKPYLQAGLHVQQVHQANYILAQQA